MANYKENHIYEHHSQTSEKKRRREDLETSKRKITYYTQGNNNQNYADFLSKTAAIKRNLKSAEIETPLLTQNSNVL